MVKAKALVLESNFSGTEVDFEVEGGFSKIDFDKEHKYEFFLDKSKPLRVTFKKGFGEDTKDFYILSWNSLVPLEFEEKVETVNKEDVDKFAEEKEMTQHDKENMKKSIEIIEKNKGQKIKSFEYRWLSPITIGKTHWSNTELPAIIRETGDMRFLKQLKTYSGEGGGGGIGAGRIALLIGGVFFAIILIWSFMYALS